MAQKERLVDLLKRSHYGNRSVVDLADYLLAEGMIVPPCKVGDTVWFHCLYEDGNPIEAGRVTAIIRRDGVDFLEIIYGHLLLGREFDEVFLTREAAEQALKERET
jgi:hypothetical protein